MSETDENLQEEVNNAVAGNDSTDAAENDQGDTGTGESSDSNDTSDSDEEAETSTEDAGGSASDTGAEDDEEDDDDDDAVDPFQQPGQQATSTSENFDIRTLPRDANGLIDPEAANKAIEKWANERVDAKLAGAQTESKAREVLTGQWEKAKEKFPYLSQNKELLGLTRDLHLNSITAAQQGTGRYLSPLAAAKRINKMYSRAVKSGVTQQKTKSTVERTATTERSGGKTGATDKTEYQKATEMANSSDRKVASEGRRKVMALRYAARHS